MFVFGAPSNPPSMPTAAEVAPSQPTIGIGGIAGANSSISSSGSNVSTTSHQRNRKLSHRAQQIMAQKKRLVRRQQQPHQQQQPRDTGTVSTFGSDSATTNATGVAPFSLVVPGIQLATFQASVDVASTPSSQSVASATTVRIPQSSNGTSSNTTTPYLVSPAPTANTPRPNHEMGDDNGDGRVAFVPPTPVHTQPIDHNRYVSSPHFTETNRHERHGFAFQFSRMSSASTNLLTDLRRANQQQLQQQISSSNPAPATSTTLLAAPEAVQDTSVGHDVSMGSNVSGTSGIQNSRNAVLGTAPVIFAMGVTDDPRCSSRLADLRNRRASQQRQQQTTTYHEDVQNCFAPLQSLSNHQDKHSVEIAYFAPNTQPRNGYYKVVSGWTRHTDAESTCCSICLEPFHECTRDSPPHETEHQKAIVVQLPSCGHLFHQSCIEPIVHRQHNGHEGREHSDTSPKCPNCRKEIRAEPFGDMPSGTMSIRPLAVDRDKGSTKAAATAAIDTHTANEPRIVVEYDIPSALQKAYHAHPGMYHGMARHAVYVPDTTAGRALVQRWVYAFRHGLTFTVQNSFVTSRAAAAFDIDQPWPCASNNAAAAALSVQRCHRQLDAIGVPPANEISTV